MKEFWNKLARRKVGVERLQPQQIKGADVLITTNEINERHGTGVILLRFFGDCGNVLSVRSQDHYEGKTFGAAQLKLNYSRLSRPECFGRMLHALNGSSARRILCVPFIPDDLISAIALKELFNIPLCTYVMDDNNICSHGIPDNLMRETLEKSALRLAISPEIREIYEQKYRLPFHLMPPLVNSALVQSEARMPEGKTWETKTGTLLGNVWSQKWLERLRSTIRDSGLKVDWFGNTSASWLKYSQEELARDGIVNNGFLPEEELIARLKNSPYAIIPSGSLDQHDDRPEIARLSQPSRMPYLMAVANTPMIVLGSRETAAARFVERFEIGVVSDYSGESFRAAVEEVCQPERQMAFRRNAAAKAPSFSLKRPGDWIWESTEKGRPADDQFEQLMPRSGQPIRI